MVKNDATGEVVSSEEYELVLPQADGKTYVLTTVDDKTVKTNKVGTKAGEMLLTFNGKDRKMTLNYSYSNGDGTTTYVNDYLQFRNRIRDGVNEWQSENPEDYK